MSAEQRICILIVKLRREGASIRAVANMIGVSKSTLHRQMRAIELIAAEASHLGQSNEPNDRATHHCNSELSQMGQGGAA